MFGRLTAPNSLTAAAKAVTATFVAGFFANCAVSCAVYLPLRRKNSNGRRSKKIQKSSVGLFVLIALIFLVCGWSWMKSFSPLHPSQRVRVMFHDVAGLNSNAAVYADGVRIGTVEDIRLAGRRKVLVGLKINPSEITLPLGCSFGIFTNGLVGARYVEVSLPELTPVRPGGTRFKGSS